MGDDKKVFEFAMVKPPDGHELMHQMLRDLAEGAARRKREREVPVEARTDFVLNVPEAIRTARARLDAKRTARPIAQILGRFAAGSVVGPGIPAKEYVFVPGISPDLSGSFTPEEIEIAHRVLAHEAGHRALRPSRWNIAPVDLAINESLSRGKRTAPEDE